MTSQEIIKYYKPNYIRLIIIALKQKQKTEIEDLYNLGWFTPREYQRFKDKDINYKQMIRIYNSRKQDWASDYIVNSYDNGYLDFESYDIYMYVYELWLNAEVSDDIMSQAMYLALQIIKTNREAENNE